MITMRSSFWRPFASALLYSLAIASAIAQVPARIIAFGDSLSDMGNTSQATFGSQPGSPYWQGRFSNGPVWVERLAARCNLSIARSRAGGYNYAHGGAESGSGYEFLILPNLITQVSQYLNARTPNPKELFVVWAGGNDYLNGSTNTDIPPQNIDNQIRRIYKAGGRRFLIPNLPLLGSIPRNLGTANEGPMNTISMQHNAKLRQRLQTTAALFPEIEIDYLDIQYLMVMLRLSPASFGFLNVTQPAYNGSTVVPLPNTYVFFDDIHPTQAAHRILGDCGYIVATDLVEVRYGGAP